MNLPKNIQPLSATVTSPDATYDHYDKVMPVTPPQAHMRGRPQDVNEQSVAVDEILNTDQHTRRSPPQSLSPGGDRIRTRSWAACDTAVPVFTPSPVKFGTKDSTWILTPTQRFCRRNGSPTNHEIQLQEINVRQDYKLRLERAKEEVRLIKSLQSKVSTSHTSIDPPMSWRAAHTEREMKLPSSASTLIKSWILWLSVLFFMMGLAFTSGLIGVIVTEKAVGVKTSKWWTLWLVCSIVLLILGGLSTSVMFMKKGNIGHTFLDRLGLNEVRNGRDADLESGRPGALLFLGVCERRASSTLGESHKHGSELDRGKHRERDQRDANSMATSGETITIDTVNYDKIQNPEWKALYTTPGQSRNPVSIRSPASSLRSKLRYNTSHEGQDPDPGAQRLHPSPDAFRAFNKSKNHEPASGSSVDRMRLKDEEGFEMVDLDRDGQKKV